MPDELAPSAKQRRERIGASQQLSLRQALTQIVVPNRVGGAALALFQPGNEIF